MLSRLGITYGVLRRLGFTEEIVEECLRGISGIELEEAFDWVRDAVITLSPHHIHHLIASSSLLRGGTWSKLMCAQALWFEIRNLPPPSDPGEGGDPGTPRSSRTGASTPMYTPQTPRTPVPRQRSLSPHSSRTLLPPTPSRLDATTPVLPSFARGPSQLREEVQAEKTDVWEPEIITPDASEPYAGGDPDAEYVRLKLEMDTHRKGSRDPESTEQLRLLQTQLDDVKQHYFFRKKDSEVQYRLERERVDSETLKAKLRGLSGLAVVPPTPPEVASPSKHRPPDLKPTEPLKTNADIFDGDSDDESPGGLFEILQEIPATETTASGSTVRLQPMEVPKHWSGRTPKVLLQETITKKDKYAVVNYACISGPSRVRRVNVSICWNGGRLQGWSMDDVGCPDLRQAEQYISTVALHSLTFPGLDGFALGGTPAANTQTFFRLFPPVFRNLWDELEAKRRESGDATNRAAWAKLRTISRMKLESQSKVLLLELSGRICLTYGIVDRKVLEDHGRREGGETKAKYPVSRAQRRPNQGRFRGS